MIVIRRPPVGFGLWRKESGPQYFSLGADHAMRVNDTAAATSQLTVVNKTTQQTTSQVWFKKNLKRTTGYQADSETDRVEWSIFGDHLRFIFAIGFKQRPKVHSHIIMFGQLTDWNDNDEEKLKWMLLGFNNSDIGNPGLNYLFMYPRVRQIVSRLFTCTAIERHKSDAIMIGLNDVDQYETIVGSADFGQHMYPIDVPQIQG